MSVSQRQKQEVGGSAVTASQPGRWVLVIVEVVCVVAIPFRVGRYLLIRLCNWLLLGWPFGWP